MLTAIGLMSGTSFDGIDLALVETDGKRRSASARACRATMTRPSARCFAVPWPMHGHDRAHRSAPASWPRPRRCRRTAHAGLVETFLRRDGIERGADRRRRLPWPDRASPARGAADRADRRRRGAGRRGSASPSCTTCAPRMSRPAGRARPSCRSSIARSSRPARSPGPIAVVNLGGVGNSPMSNAGGIRSPSTRGRAMPARRPDARAQRASPMDRDGAAALAGHVDETALAAMMAHRLFPQVAAEVARPQRFLSRGGVGPLDGRCGGDARRLHRRIGCGGFHIPAGAARDLGRLRRRRAQSARSWPTWRAVSGRRDHG